MEGQQGGEGQGGAGNGGQTTTPAADAGKGGGQGQGGAFDRLALKLPQTPVPGQENAEGGEGEQGTEEGGGKTAASGTETPTKKLFAGKFPTIEEFEKAYDSSGQEAFRLFLKNKEYGEKETKWTVREKELMSEIERLKTAPVSNFKPLSDEAVKQLRQDDPAAYADYLDAKKEHEWNTKRQQETADAKRRETEAETKKREGAIFGRIREMEGNPEQYPDFKALQPVMDELIDMTEGGIAGKTWGPDIAYLAALGVKSLQTGKAANAEKRKAEEAARLKAGGAARGSGAAGAGAEGDGSQRTDADSDEALNNRIINAGKKPVLGW